jgi:hypothetical protein
MEIDIRRHLEIRSDVAAGLAVLRVQGRQIWGVEPKYNLEEIVVRLMVGIGDLARVARECDNMSAAEPPNYKRLTAEIKKELGNIIFSTIRWVDDLGLDALECLDLAIEAQETFARSGRPR